MLTKEQILDVAEDVLRKFGPRKTTVVDVARALNVSHGTVYRHFVSKAALHEAITTRWIERITLPLAEIANGGTQPKQRLREWFQTLMDIKLAKAQDDPEMFASYSLLAQQMAKDVIFKHLDAMIKQVEIILLAGVEDGTFTVQDCASTARSLFIATFRYHHPLHVDEWGDERIREDFNDLFLLLEKAIHKFQ
ncbi:TetR family transcriptional regulator [Aliamphritea ceti]|uniref:TetR family transcriptional regulator n=1 Tax=Aliamphritea ceti TaxID=1524258 RepID=UPI0021C2EE26|nr:TetR family transcriptional regulator [Aliamphritea ceti]